MFDHFVAVDWAMSNMAIARMTKKSDKIKVIDVPSDIKELKIYLKGLPGKVCLTYEESTTSQWLYTELRDKVDKILVCDPYRNKLLSEGPKTDSIDASKLVLLLKANLLKEVFHSNDKFVQLRKIVSAYEDVVKAGVRLKNQRSALFRAVHKNHKKEVVIDNPVDKFVLNGLDYAIENYELERERYKKEFERYRKNNPEIKRLTKIPGIGDIFACQIISRIVDAKRFPNRNSFFSYCGLVKLDRVSGGRIYGKKNPRYSRMMKSIFKSATIAVINKNNQFNTYFDYLINNQNYSDHNARNAVARKIAATVYGVMKSGKKYEPNQIRKENVKKGRLVDL